MNIRLPLDPRYLTVPLRVAAAKYTKSPITDGEEEQEEERGKGEGDPPELFSSYFYLLPFCLLDVRTPDVSA